MSNSNSSDTFFAFVLGGLVGAVVGILYAPRAGKETREKIRAVTDDFGNQFVNAADGIREKSERAVSDVKERISEQKSKIEAAIDAGKKAYENKQG